MISNLITLAVLMCPLGMGIMMWMMMRRGPERTGDGASPSQAEVNELRHEIESLRRTHPAQADTRPNH